MQNLKSYLIRSSQKVVQPVKVLVSRYPFGSFLALLVGLLAIIGVSNFFRNPAVEGVTEVPVVKEVNVYRIGEAARVTVNAEVEKSGVITVAAQSPGIVNKVAVKAGQRVKKGASLVSLASNYGGGNVSSLQRQLAQQQYEFNKNTFDLQKEAIAKNKEIAEQTAQNSAEMRAIAEQSLTRTNELISNSHSIFDALSEQLTLLEAQTTETLADAATDENLILGLRQQQMGILNALNAAEQASRSARLQADSDKPGRKLADLGKEATLKQLELQEKSLTLGLETSELNYRLAQLQESLMAPTAPFAGVVDYVHVKAGETVSPGMPLVTLVAEDQEVTLNAAIPQMLAQRLSTLEASLLKVGGNEWELSPGYVSTEPISAGLFKVSWTLLTEDEMKSGKGGLIQPELMSLKNEELTIVEIPVGHADTGSAFPFIPIDAVHQTPDQAELFVNVNGQVESRVVKPGSVFGQYVEILEGLKSGDEVILERNVIEGDKVKVANL